MKGPDPLGRRYGLPAVVVYYADSGLSDGGDWRLTIQDGAAEKKKHIKPTST
jgi:hypothetical protein